MAQTHQSLVPHELGFLGPELDELKAVFHAP
jgi:hypothetical protein